jgi:diguanylate cyclase (GGDEF)-like protein
MAVLFMEVNDFEELRGRIGSDAADEMLRDLGNRMVASLRGEDSVSRTRTAEYAVLLPEVDSIAGAELVGRKLVDVFERPFDAAGAEEIGATLGAAVYPDHALTIVGLLTAADAALQHAKDNGSGDVVLYAEGMARQPRGGPQAT